MRSRSPSSSLSLAVLACLAGLGACAGSPAQGPAAPPSACPTVPSVTPRDAPAAKVDAAPSKSDALPVDEVAAELIKRVNARDGAGLVALFGDGMRGAFPEGKTGPFVQSLLDSVGELRSFEREPKRDPRSATYRVAAERGELRMHLDVDGAGRITGMSFKPAPPPDPPVVSSTIPLGLPFKGQWTVIWGGADRSVNHHVEQPSQRRAADLCVTTPEGSTHRGDGKKNEDYLAYGQDVIAVADGQVVQVVDGVPENVPGKMNRVFVPGNLVIVKHAGGVYSAYAHLVPGKIRVKVGASLKRGDVIGLCGNSGNSSEPHLHFQLQDGPTFEESWGVDAVFADVPVVRGAETSRHARYTFLKGDRIGATPVPDKPGKPTKPAR